jgi:LuxR family maltose regulon positive regulatory protein
MTDPILMTKVSLPILRRLLVSRGAVLKQLTEGIQEGHILTLVSAPAGYGKTTTIRMWVEEIGHPVAWVTLEPSDNDLKEFLRYILTAMMEAEEDVGLAALEEVENTRKINPRRILGLLIQDLTALHRPIILVLEDYQAIENEKIDQFVDTLLNQSVPNLHVVITTREDPSLALTRLRARNLLTEIRALDLSFTLDEASEFIAKVMGVLLPPADVELLKDRTEGWVAGLQLAALSLKECEDITTFLEGFQGTHRHILHFLIDEVVDRQPEDVRKFLQRTSILDQLSPSLCEAVTGQGAGLSYLHYLEDNNLFLVSLDEKRTWYRYHALFGELLRYQLTQTEPDEVDLLHERAATWYQENGYIYKAVEHAFQISSSSRLASLIEEYALPMLYLGEVSTVVGWFDRIPVSLMRSSPLMCVGKAWALALMLRQTRTEEVEQTLKAAEDALSTIGAGEALRKLIAGHIASIQAYLLRAPALAGKEPDKVIEISQKAQQLLPKEERGIRSVNDLNIGYGYAALADLAAAEQAFRCALEDGVAGGNFYAAVYGPISLIFIAMMKGQLDEALRMCDTYLEHFNRLLAGKSFPPIGALSILKGSILLEQNRLLEAEQALTLGLSLERWTDEFRAHTKGYSALARLRSIQGDWPGMFAGLNSLEETRPEGVIHAQALRHRLTVQHGLASEASLEEAQRWVTQAALRFDNLPDISGLDPVSEVKFQAYLSAAHVRTRLAARNPQTASLQDVHDYFSRQEKFAAAQGLVGWLVEIWIVRALMYQVEGKLQDARHTLRSALHASAEHGFFRLFLDEHDLLLPLLRSMEAHLEEGDLSLHFQRLLEAMPGGSVRGRRATEDRERLSARELEVLGLLAAGKSYKEIGQDLFLSLNTIQFHVKNIYGKLQVNKRGQAVDRAREEKLIPA